MDLTDEGASRAGRRGRKRDRAGKGHAPSGKRSRTARAPRDGFAFAVDLEQQIRRLQECIREDRALVQQFFLQLGQTIPLWLVLGFLNVMVDELRHQNLIDSLRAPLGMDPDGNGPMWG